MNREHLSEKSVMGLNMVAMLFSALISLIYYVKSTDPIFLLMIILLLITLSFAVITFILSWNYIHKNEDIVLAVFCIVFSGTIIAVMTLALVLVILLAILAIKSSK